MTRLLAFAWEEATASLRAAGRTALLSLWTIAIAFVVTGAFLVALRATGGVVDAWAEGAEISVYLHADAGEAERRLIESRLSGADAVASVEFVTSAEALTRFTRSFPDLRDVTASLSGNPFPASFEVRLRDGASSAAADALVSGVRLLPGVDDVRYERDLVQRLLRGVRTARLAGTVVTLTLLLGAALTVTAVVRLSMQPDATTCTSWPSSGRPVSYIRGPFVAEARCSAAWGHLSVWPCSSSRSACWLVRCRMGPSCGRPWSRDSVSSCSASSSAVAQGSPRRRTGRAGPASGVDSAEDRLLD